jgi:hypothetical protein
VAAGCILTMRHVFVETNWIFDYAAPAHRKDPAAVELLERAGRGEVTLTADHTEVTLRAVDLYHPAPTLPVEATPRLHSSLLPAFTRHGRTNHVNASKPATSPNSVFSHSLCAASAPPRLRGELAFNAPCVHPAGPMSRRRTDFYASCIFRR